MQHFAQSWQQQEVPLAPHQAIILALELLQLGRPSGRLPGLHPPCQAYLKAHQRVQQL